MWWRGCDPASVKYCRSFSEPQDFEHRVQLVYNDQSSAPINSKCGNDTITLSLRLLVFQSESCHPHHRKYRFTPSMVRLPKPRLTRTWANSFPRSQKCHRRRHCPIPDISTQTLHIQATTYSYERPPRFGLHRGDHRRGIILCRLQIRLGRYESVHSPCLSRILRLERHIDVLDLGS